MSLTIGSVPEQKQRLQGKVAIITGGASGIGESAAALFSENGAIVIIADIQDDAGQALADKLGKNVSYIHCDVSIENDIINLVDTTIEKHGKLDIMYNNAGIIDKGFGSILDTTKSDLDRVLAVNLIGSFMGAKHATRVMVSQKKGCLLFTGSACTSIAGLGTPAYAVSKYGVYGLVRNLAAEVGKYGIRVNCVSPYAVITNIGKGINEGNGGLNVDTGKLEQVLSDSGNLKGEILRADAIARGALYLASDEANYVSGHNLVVDGGFSTVNPSLMNALSHLQS